MYGLLTALMFGCLILLLFPCVYLWRLQKSNELIRKWLRVNQAYTDQKLLAIQNKLKITSEDLYQARLQREKDLPPEEKDILEKAHFDLAKEKQGYFFM